MFIKQTDLNQKTQEVFAKSRMDLGLWLLKSVVFLVFVLPVTLAVSKGVDPDSTFSSIVDFSNFGFSALVAYVFFVFGLGWYERNQGLKLLNTVYAAMNDEAEKP